MAKIDDKQIKELIAKYQQSGEGFEDIARILSDYIYNYPRLRFRQGEDVCGDFYLYFFERLEKALQKYSKQECLFITWLSVVLRRYYLNWVQSEGAQESKTYLYLEGFPDGGELYQAVDFENPLVREDSRENIEALFGDLPKKVRIVMKLYYFDYFRGEDLREAHKAFSQPMSLLMSKYDAILNYAAKQYDKERELEDKLNQVFREYSDCRARLESLKKSDPNPDEKSESLNKKVKLYEGRHKKILSERLSFQVRIKNELISDLLGISLSATHNLIYRGKALLKEIMAGGKNET